ncbi:hypothetical protein BGW38_009513, partial [Lunasporangiospora selenospora]
GRAEVWQALRAACEEKDATQVQAILDAARITVPSNRSVEMTSGSPSGNGQGNARPDPMAQLTCYDALGTMYVVPVKFLSVPTNLIEDVHHGDDDDNNNSNTRGNTALVGSSSSVSISHHSTGTRSHAGPSVRSASSSSTGAAGKGRKEKERADPGSRTTSTGQVTGESMEKIIVRIRLSIRQKEILLTVTGATTIGQIKEDLFKESAASNANEGSSAGAAGGSNGSSSDSSSTLLVPGRHRLKVFFLGRVIDDKERLNELPHFQGGQQGTVLQVLVFDL